MLSIMESMIAAQVCLHLPSLMPPGHNPYAVFRNGIQRRREQMHPAGLRRVRGAHPMALSG